MLDRSFLCRVGGRRGAAWCSACRTEGSSRSGRPCRRLGFSRLHEVKRAFPCGTRVFWSCRCRHAAARRRNAIFFPYNGLLCAVSRRNLNIGFCSNAEGLSRYREDLAQAGCGHFGISKSCVPSGPRNREIARSRRAHMTGELRVTRLASTPQSRDWFLPLHLRMVIPDIAALPGSIGVTG